MSQYTDELVAALNAKKKWTYAEAVAFAGEHDLKPRSVIAKIGSLNIPYEKKPERVTKKGEPVILKAQYVRAIEDALGVVIPSLTKLTKTDLAVLNFAVEGEEPEPQPES